MSRKETGRAGGSLQARSDDQLSGSISSEITASANAVKFHPLADLVPPMTDEEFDILVADIKANGLRESIMLHEGMILDGRHRYRACKAAGWDEATILSGLHARHFCPEVDGDPAAYVISANIHRRHLTLTPEQKRELIAKLIEAQPQKSDRQIAKQVKADHKTVGAVRKKKEATGEVSPVDKRVGADGKARRPPKLTARQRKLARNKARHEREIEESRRRAEGRKVFAEKVRCWVKTLSAEQAKSLQELVEDECADDESFVLVRELRHGIEINLTGVDAKCWRVQYIKNGRRFGNVLYFDWGGAQRFAARLEEANPGVRTVLVPVLESDEVRSAGVPNAMMTLVPGEEKQGLIIIHPCYADDTWIEETEGGHEAYTALIAKRETCSATPNADDAEASAEAMKARFAADEAAS